MSDPFRIVNAATVLDPVCGMQVVPARAAATVEHDGKTYSFCSPHCATKFKADPERYLRAPGSAPMHAAPLVQLGASGSTSSAPSATALPAGGGRALSSTSYICPMDPEVRASAP